MYLEEIPTLWDPDGSFRHLREDFDSVPTFLFRTYTPASWGINNEREVGSALSFFERETDDLLSKPQLQAQRELDEHTRWYKDYPSNLVSWTSSLLFAVHFGIQRIIKNSGHYGPADVKICILNTKFLPQGTFLPATALLEAYGIPYKDRANDGHFVAEYLAQGRIRFGDNSSEYVETITLKQLWDNGICDLHPPFRENWDQLDCPVRDARGAFKRRAAATTQKEWNLANKVANGCQIDNKRTRFVMVMMLLSLKPRPRNDHEILESVRPWRCSKFAVYGLPIMANHNAAQYIFREDLDNLSSISDAVPEHAQFVTLMHDVHADGERHEWILEGEGK